MKVGFIGLGIMGRPMAKNLLNAGVELLVSDLNKKKIADVLAAGAKEATYAEIGEQCGRIIIMVPSGAISKSILFDEDGVASTIKEGTVVCDMSSVTPVESKECYEGLEDKGVGFVDAPVSGGEPGAVAGTLAIIVTSKGEETAEEIGRITDRGVTSLEGMGTYTKSKRNVLLCACSKSEAYLVKNAVYQVDDSAFVMFTETSEVLGEGFKESLDEL